MKIVKIEEVRLNPKNPRIIKDAKFKKLVDSLRDFPEMANVRPIVVNTEMVVLGGNMRLKAMIEAKWENVPVVVVDWSKEKQDEFVIKDNLSYGEWDYEALADWDKENLEFWGLDFGGFDLDDEDLNTSFLLPSGEKAPFQQMTFTLADKQAEQIKNAIAKIKQTEEYKYIETMGNENSNGNALYLIVTQWVEQKK